MSTIPLSELTSGSQATIQQVVSRHSQDLIAQRLCDLGFTPGESIQIIALTPFKMGPLVIKLGMTRFALRHTEAARILVKEIT